MPRSAARAAHVGRTGTGPAGVRGLAWGSGKSLSTASSDSPCRIALQGYVAEVSVPQGQAARLPAWAAGARHTARKRVARRPRLATRTTPERRPRRKVLRRLRFIPRPNREPSFIVHFLTIARCQSAIVMSGCGAPDLSSSCGPPAATRGRTVRERPSGCYDSPGAPASPPAVPSVRDAEDPEGAGLLAVSDGYLDLAVHVLA